jgi:hypothetical protein
MLPAVNAAPEAVRCVAADVDRHLPRPWLAWPGGRPGEIEVALIDTVLSIRNVYGRPATEHRPATGVHAAVERYRAHRGSGPLDDLQALARFHPEHLATVLCNRQKTSGNPKAAAIVQAATALLAVGVRHADDLRGDDATQRRAYSSVRGLATVTWVYLAMLLGQPGVKSDTWVCRFVARALGRDTTPDEAGTLVRAVAAELGESPSHLDHAIWDFMRRR